MLYSKVLLKADCAEVSCTIEYRQISQLQLVKSYLMQAAGF